jgi:ferrochelatase
VVRDYYRQIGGRSPIGEITRGQAEALERRLGAGFRCYVAMRYSRPFTDEAVARARQDGAERLVGLTLYPHYSSATSGSSFAELRRQAERANLPLLEVDRFFDDAAYLDALADRAREGLAAFSDGEAPLVLFSAHGLPVSFIRRGDPYLEHLYVTIAGVVARLAATSGRVPEWRLSFQSRAGRARWLEPATDETLRALAASGRRRVLVVPISFVSDHIETLYEIDLLFGGEARALGLELRRAPSLNEAPRFIEALAGLVERRLSLAEQAAATPALSVTARTAKLLPGRAPSR